MSSSFSAAIPILRIYDEALARQFYVDYLGMTVDWEHRYEPTMPLYMQVSLGGMTLHLSQHYGDGTPGGAVYIDVDPLQPFLAGLQAKQASFARPSAGCDDATLTDPFGNMLRFAQP